MAYAVRGDKPDVHESARVSSRVHQRQCASCHRWFWAWHPDRYRCFVCEPLPPSELRAVLARIQRCAV